MDETNKRFVKWVLYTPIRIMKGLVENIKQIGKPLKPKTLFRVAIAFLIITLIIGDFWIEIIGLILVVVAWMNLQWVRGDWRVNPPTEPKLEQNR